MIEVRELTKRYADRTVLDGVSIDRPSGLNVPPVREYKPVPAGVAPRTMGLPVTVPPVWEMTPVPV